jgi:hypothetical protein
MPARPSLNDTLPIKIRLQCRRGLDIRVVDPGLRGAALPCVPPISSGAPLTGNALESPFTLTLGWRAFQRLVESSQDGGYRKLLPS